MEITAYEVKARWAYAELNSTRWGGSNSATPPAILAMAREGVPFQLVPSSKYPALVDWLLHGRARDFVANVDRSEHYVLKQISKMQLMALWAISSFNATKTDGVFPYAEFYHERMKRGRNDPRDVIETIPRSPFNQLHPVIVVNWDGLPVLLEGYLRSLLFLRSDEAGSILQTWWPKELAPAPVV